MGSLGTVRYAVVCAHRQIRIRPARRGCLLSALPYVDSSDHGDSVAAACFRLADLNRVVFLPLLGLSKTVRARSAARNNSERATNIRGVARELHAFRRIP